MTQSNQPSVALLLDPSHQSFAQIPSVARAIAAADEALEPYLASGAVSAEVPLSKLFGDRDDMFKEGFFLFNLLPDGFATLSARTPGGEVRSGFEFSALLVRMARAFSAGKADDEAAQSEAFYQVDLQALREAAAQPAPQDAPTKTPRSRARP